MYSAVCCKMAACKSNRSTGILTEIQQHILSVFVGSRHLAELFSICVGQQRFEGLEARVNALHAPTFVAVRDFSADPSLLVLGCLGTEGDVGQAEEVSRRDGYLLTLAC